MHEIFLEVEKARGRKAKIAALHANSSKNLKQFLDYTFNENINWLVPPGNPPFEPSKDDANLLRGRIHQDFRLFQHFLSNGPYPNMTQHKRENMFISLLESLHVEDAKLICYVKDNRSLPYKTVTRELIEEAFPIFTKNWSKKETSG